LERASPPPIFFVCLFYEGPTGKVPGKTVSS
jgi:hypothetical protein